jgi:hypothetical protein
MIGILTGSSALKTFVAPTCKRSTLRFGNKRFSFETLELDRSHANINKILKRKNVPEEEKIPTLLEVLLARTRAPLYSFQVGVAKRNGIWPIEIPDLQSTNEEFVSPFLAMYINL